MAILRIKNIPINTTIAVFGMTENQWSVNGDPDNVYYSDRPNVTELELELSPPSARLLIRARHRELRWRTDKEFCNPDSDSYQPEWVGKWCDEIEIDLDDYLEADSVMREPKKVPPAISVDEISNYKPVRAVIPSELQSSHYIVTSLTDDLKHIYALIPQGKRKEIEYFRHSLPREINWLLYGRLPVSTTESSLTFFYYEFGPDHGIDSEILTQEPWRLDKKNNELQATWREDFAKKVVEWGGSIHYLNTRELRKVAPVFQEAFPLTLPEILSFGSPIPLWRYIDLPKFVNLLVTSNLWFARPSTFDDPFEAKTNKKTRVKHLLRQIHRLIDDYNTAVHDKDEAYLNRNEWWVEGLVDSSGIILPKHFKDITDIPSQLMLLAESTLDEDLNATLINCWHKNENENDGMWRAYTDTVHAVAIVTTFDDLKSCFQTKGYTPRIAEVNYSDLHDESIEFDHLPTVYKHTAFKYENEVRAYLRSNLPSDSPGMNMPVDLKILINKIVLAPNAPDWFEENIKWLMNQNGLYDIPVERSLFKSTLY